MEAAYVERVRLRARRQLQYLALRDRPCVTKDGVPVDAAAQCRPRRRPAAYRGDRRRRHRAVPHRAAVHGGGDAAAHRRAVLALPRGARRRRRQAGDLPHPRYRRRQGAALYAQRGGGEPGARLARDPARPRPARPVAHPDPRAAAGRRRARAQADVPDDRRGRGIRRGQGAGRARADPSAPPRPQAARTGSRSAPWSRCRRCSISSTS